MVIAVLHQRKETSVQEVALRWWLLLLLLLLLVCGRDGKDNGGEHDQGCQGSCSTPTMESRLGPLPSSAFLGLQTR